MFDNTELYIIKSELFLPKPQYSQFSVLSDVFKKNIWFCHCCCL